MWRSKCVPCRSHNLLALPPEVRMRWWGGHIAVHCYRRPRPEFARQQMAAPQSMGLTQERPDPFDDFLAQLGDLALRDAGEPHRLHQVIDRRVETPPSSMTATRAVSVVRRASRKGGK